MVSYWMTVSFTKISTMIASLSDINEFISIISTFVNCIRINAFYIYMHNDILLSISPLPHSSLLWGLLTFCKCCYSCNCSYQYEQVAGTACSKTQNMIAVLFSETIIPRTLLGQDKDAIKRHFKEQRTWYNCTLLVWVIFWNQEKLTVVLNQCTWGRLM